MAKRPKLHFICNNCQTVFPRWYGQCGHCGSWNSLSEAPETPPTQAQTASRKGFAGHSSLSGIQIASAVARTPVQRLSTGIAECDRVLGGGMVPGSVTLIGGDPGAGKSTLLLQISSLMSATTSVLYVSGEESLSQIALHLDRLQLRTEKLLLLAETQIEHICELSRTVNPKVIIIDSIQVMHTLDNPSTPGSLSQVKETAALLTQFAKQTGIAIVLVGHVTKEGVLAGPKVLEHCVDSSLLLEATAGSKFRTLRSQKNRFGSVQELGFFAMTPRGLRELVSPSAIFLSRPQAYAPGSAVMVILEGNRPLLVEVQALIDPVPVQNSRRVTVGIDPNRLALLLAILHRHGQMKMGQHDIFINVVGGLKVSDTGADLPILGALVSSMHNVILPNTLTFFGEVGLSGEIRPVPSGQERILAAAKQGFTQIIVPNANRPSKTLVGIEILPVQTVRDLLAILLPAERAQIGSPQPQGTMANQRAR